MQLSDQPAAGWVDVNRGAFAGLVAGWLAATTAEGWAAARLRPAIHTSCHAVVTAER